MARIQPLDQPGVVVRSVLREVRRRYGKAPASMTIAARSRPTFFGAVAFELGLERASKVDARLKELATVKTAMLVGCEFCCDIGSFIARAGGVSEDELHDLLTYRDSPRFDGCDVAVLDYAVAMAQTPSAVDDALTTRLREHLDDDQVVELTATIAWEHYRARLNHALDVDPGGFSAGAFCVAPERAAASAAVA